MNNKSNYGPSAMNLLKFFSFLRVGKFYWRLWSLPFMGFSLSFVAYQLSSDAAHGERVLFLSYNALFYTILLSGLAFIGSSIRDHLGGTKMLEQILLWPMEERKKMFVLYLRSTWIPLIFLLIGGLIGSTVISGQGNTSLLPALPYGLGAGFFLSVLIWKGSFDSIDSGTVIGSATFRNERRLTLLTFILTLSPLSFDFAPYILRIPVSLTLFSLGVIYQVLPLDPLQFSAGTKDFSHLKHQERRIKLIESEEVRNPIRRYFYFLEWDELKKPGIYYGIIISAVFFITTIYYILGGYYFPDNPSPVTDRSLFLGFLIAYGTFFVYNASILVMDVREIEVLLPISDKTRSVAKWIHRFLRPTFYLILNGVFVSALIALLHFILMQFTSLEGIPYGSFVGNALRYALFLLPFTLAFFSITELLLTGITFGLQRMGFLGANKWLMFVFFGVYLIPLIVSLLSFGENPSVLSVLWTPQMLLMYMGIVFFSQWGIHWSAKRIQVI